MGTFLTIGYVQSKMIRMPLNLNEEFNNSICNFSSLSKLTEFINDKGTYDERCRLKRAIKVLKETNKEGKS